MASEFSAALDSLNQTIVEFTESIAQSVYRIALDVYTRSTPAWLVEKDGFRGYCFTQDQIDWYCSRGWRLVSVDPSLTGLAEIIRSLNIE